MWVIIFWYIHATNMYHTSKFRLEWMLWTAAPGSHWSIPGRVHRHGQGEGPWGARDVGWFPLMGYPNSWMVKGKSQSKMDDDCGYHPIHGNPHMGRNWGSHRSLGFRWKKIEVLSHVITFSTYHLLVMVSGLDPSRPNLSVVRQAVCCQWL